MSAGRKHVRRGQVLALSVDDAATPPVIQCLAARDDVAIVIRDL
jgi:hypothetical protein